MCLLSTGHFFFFTEQVAGSHLSQPLHEHLYAVRIELALVRESGNERSSFFDGPLIWLLPLGLGNERITGVRRQAFG